MWSKNSYKWSFKIVVIIKRENILRNLSLNLKEFFEKNIQKITDLNIENIEKILNEKEKEISQI